MKKLFALLIALVMLLSLAACGGDQGNQNDPVKPDNSSNTGNQDGTLSTVETGLFSVSYSADWVNQEDYLEDDDDYCFVNLQVLDPEDPDYYLIDVEISVSLEDPYDFREDLVYYDFNQYEYEVNKSYPTTAIGGVDLLKYDDGDETLVYFNRVENAGATICIDFDAVDISDARIAALLSGITFNIEDVGNEDGPWEWEGEPFYTEDHSVNAGGYTLTSKFLPFEAPVCTFETFDHSIAAAGNMLYILADGELMQCQNDGSTLAFVAPVQLPEDDYEIMSATNDGSVWLSGSLNDIVRVKDGAIVGTYEDIDNLVMHPAGNWGLSYFVSNECSIISFSGDSFTATPITFYEVDTIMHVSIDENNIYICASAADDSGHKIFIYGKDGVLKNVLCDSEGEGMGSITFVTQTANGFIGFDGNMRDVILWDNSGKFMAEFSDGDLFDTSYPWFCASTVAADGSIYTLMTDERDDRSATELLVFQIKGF